MRRFVQTHAPLFALLACLACDEPHIAQQAKAERVTDVPTQPAPEPVTGDTIDYQQPSLTEPVLDAEQPSAVPPGFPPADRFDTVSDACTHLTIEMVEPKWQHAVYNFCERRSYASSRYRVIESRVDGSQIHDRDRAFAWRFYGHGQVSGHIRPDTCEHHRIDETIDHPRAERKLINNWPFGRPEMTGKLKGQWLNHPHDVERFGTRGAHDNNLATAVRWIPGCYPPEVLDRNDVNVSVTILRAVAICQDFGCRSERDIKQHWRRGPKRGTVTSYNPDVSG